MTASLGLERLHVPANASRFMATADAARTQETAVVDLAWDAADPWLFNIAFDESKIRHDDSYCTSVVDLDEVVQVPTLDYLFDRVLPHVGGSRTVIDIGCGQGEFVAALRDRGVDAAGYDPVVRNPSAHLHDRYWTGDEAPADLYVMRCVLPHIPSPWAFLDEIGKVNPEALVLIEFQALEWMLTESVWYQISHDHVNLFAPGDFEDRYDVLADGSFSAGEWSWVLVRAASRRPVAPRPCPVESQLRSLLQHKAAALQSAAERRTVHLWGAAGKGIVLGYALIEAGVGVPAAIDADRRRWGLFMETSGIPIFSPEEARDLLPADALVLVCNPNHLESVRQFAPPSWDVRVPSDLARPR